MCKFAVTPHATICLELLSEMPAPWLTVGSFATLGAVVITTRSGDDGGRNTTPVFGVARRGPSRWEKDTEGTAGVGAKSPRGAVARVGTYPSGNGRTADLVPTSGPVGVCEQLEDGTLRCRRDDLGRFRGPARTLSPIGDRIVCGPLTATTGRVVVVVGLGTVVVGVLVVGWTVVGVALFPVRLQPPATRARVVSPTAVKTGQEGLFVLPACLSLGRTSILRMLAQASSGSVAVAV